MEKLLLVSISTETEKPVKKEFDFPVCLIIPITKERTIKGVKTFYVSSGSIGLSKEAMKVLNPLGKSTVTISETGAGLILYDSSLIIINEKLKKKLTPTGLLRITEKNVSRIYSDNSALPKTEAWYFRLEERSIDLPGVEDAKVYVFIPLEKRA